MANTLELGNGKWATGKDTVLAFNDENNNFKPLPFSFSRNSSATVVNKDGLIETVGSGEPRIDFKDNTKGALLLEPNRTNLITYSENLNGSGWSNTGTTITENQSISPDGSLNADLIELDSNLDRLAAVLGSTGGTYTFSFYIKAKEGESGVWRTRVNGDSTLWQNTQVNDTEWTRVTQTFTKTGSGNIVVYPAYRVDGTSTLFNAYIYGAQLEVGSYPTSYIPTSGSAVTRVADSSNQIVPNGIYGTNEVTFVIDFEINGDTPTYSSIFNTNKNTASSFGVTRQDENGRLKPFLFSSGVNVGDMTSTTAFLNGVRGKFAVGYKNGDSVLVVQGSVEDTNSATFSDFNVNEIHLNDLVTYFGYHTNLKIYDFKLYNTRLSNSELAALTS
jgi:hypothetical protein